MPARTARSSSASCWRRPTAITASTPLAGRGFRGIAADHHRGDGRGEAGEEGRAGDAERRHGRYGWHGGHGLLKLRAGFDHRKRILKKREHHGGSPRRGGTSRVRHGGGRRSS